MKKLIAIMLTAVLAVSVSACSDKNDNDKTDESVESVAEVSEEIKMPEIDIDPDVQKMIEDKYNPDSFGPLTKYAIQMLESKNLQLEFSVEQIKDEDEEESSKKESSKEESSKKSESSSSFDLSSLGGSMDLILTKNFDKDIRINLGMGMVSFDILKNKDGVFSMNTRRKTYKVLQTAEQLSKLESEASSDSSGQASRAIESIKDAMGDMTDEFDVDEFINTDRKIEITLKDSGEAEYKYKDYKFESYTVVETDEIKKSDDKKSDSSKSESKQVSESSGKTETKTYTSQMTCYFDEENIIQIIHVESDQGNFDITINNISSEIDSDELIVPDNYEQKESSKIDLSELSALLSDDDDDEDE